MLATTMKEKYKDFENINFQLKSHPGGWLSSLVG